MNPGTQYTIQHLCTSVKTIRKVQMKELSKKYVCMMVKS